MTECPHGDDPATCPPCRREVGKDATLAQQPVQYVYGGLFEAALHGQCPCGLPIYPGQVIRSGTAAGAVPVYVHGSCTP